MLARPRRQLAIQNLVDARDQFGRLWRAFKRHAGKQRRGEGVCDVVVHCRYSLWLAATCCRWKLARPVPGTPSKGRPAARASSPFPPREALREEGAAAKPLRGRPFT